MKVKVGDDLETNMVRVDGPGASFLRRDLMEKITLPQKSSFKVTFIYG